MSTETEKKKWKVRTTDQAYELSFLPIFEITKKDNTLTQDSITEKDVECRYVDIEVPDSTGKVMTFHMNFLDLYMFIYFIANEELRQQLQLRYERQATQIPYEVTFKITPEEKERGVAKRLITLTVDEITMAIAHAGAQSLIGKGSKDRSIEEYVYRKKKEQKIIVN